MCDFMCFDLHCTVYTGAHSDSRQGQGIFCVFNLHLLKQTVGCNMLACVSVYIQPVYGIIFMSIVEVFQHSMLACNVYSLFNESHYQVGHSHKQM